MPLETKLNSCYPEKSAIDALIFHEITGKEFKVNDDDELLPNDNSNVYQDKP